MDKVISCVERISLMFDALEDNDRERLELLCSEIAELEHAADLMKNEIRNNLPNSLFLPIDRNNLLEILSLQDYIADCAEDIAVLLTLRPLKLFDDLKPLLRPFLEKNIEAFHEVAAIIREWQDLLESSFGGVEAQRVRQMISNVSHCEHEVDIMQRKVLKVLYSTDQLDFQSFDLWMRIFMELAGISNLSEKLANRIRLALDLK